MRPRCRLTLLAWTVAALFSTTLVVHAADTVLTFDDVTADTLVATHYHAQGVDFSYPPYASLPSTSQIPDAVVCCFPITRAPPPGHPDQVADISLAGMEFWRAGLFGTFSTFRNRVTMTVGDFLPDETANLTLTLYDKNGVQLGQPGQASVTGREGTATTAVAAGATPEVAFFLVQADEMNRHVWVDELAFNDPTTAAPLDFTIAVQGIQPPTFYVTRGGSTTASLPVVRYNGSNGDIKEGP